MTGGSLALIWGLEKQWSATGAGSSGWWATPAVLQELVLMESMAGPHASVLSRVKEWGWFEGLLKDLWRPYLKALSLYLLYILLCSRRDLRIWGFRRGTLRFVETRGGGRFEQDGAVGPQQWPLFSPLGEEARCLESDYRLSEKSDSERLGGMGWVPGLVGISGRTHLCCLFDAFPLDWQLLPVSTLKSQGEIYLHPHIHAFTGVNQRNWGSFLIMSGPLFLNSTWKSGVQLYQERK